MKWINLLGTAANDDANDVTVDKSGNIYVTGNTVGDLGGETNAGNWDAFLAKYKGSSFPWEIFYPAFIKKK